MTDHPSTYSADETHREGIQWDDRASIHKKDDGQGLLDGMKGLYRGSFAEMVRMLVSMPDRDEFVIQKAGDRQFSADEAVALSNQPDFPA